MTTKTERLKSMVSDNKRVYFVFYRDGNLWYKTESDFVFPVPIEDIGNATFNAEDKAMLFMRYIRKHLDTHEEAREALDKFTNLIEKEFKNEERI